MDTVGTPRPWGSVREEGGEQGCVCDVMGLRGWGEGRERERGRDGRRRGWRGEREESGETLRRRIVRNRSAGRRTNMRRRGRGT